MDREKFDQKLKSADRILKLHLNREKVNVYKIAAKTIEHENDLLKDSCAKEYGLRIEGLKSNSFAIYGKGYFGKNIYWDLLKIGLKPRYFLVTKRKKDDVDKLYGIPVLELADWNEKDVEVIIGVSHGLQYELIKNLVKIGCTNYFRCPY